MIIQKDFTSIDKEHLIRTTIIEDVGWFQVEHANFEKYKTFFLLIKDCMDYFKESGVNYIKQYVLISDLESFKSSTVSIIDDETAIITTPFGKFIDELISALGINIV